MDINLYKISENQFLDPKFDTWKVFGTRKPILASDFDNFQISVNYNAMSSGQKSSKILKIGMKSQKIDVLSQNFVPEMFSDMRIAVLKKISYMLKKKSNENFW